MSKARDAAKKLLRWGTLEEERALVERARLATRIGASFQKALRYENLILAKRNGKSLATKEFDGLDHNLALAAVYQGGREPDLCHSHAPSEYQQTLFDPKEDQA